MLPHDGSHRKGPTFSCQRLLPWSQTTSFSMVKTSLSRGLPAESNFSPFWKTTWKKKASKLLWIFQSFVSLMNCFPSFPMRKYCWTYVIRPRLGSRKVEIFEIQILDQRSTEFNCKSRLDRLYGEWWTFQRIQNSLPFLGRHFQLLAIRNFKSSMISAFNELLSEVTLSPLKNYPTIAAILPMNSML